MNQCDHGHETPNETRSMPLGGGANLILCRFHVVSENAYRSMRAEETGAPENWKIEPWEDLKTYATETDR